MRLSLLAIMQDEAPLVGRWWRWVKEVEPTFDEIVVIDGGSVDGTAAALRALGVRTFDRPFPGDFAEQRNFGIDQTTGEWVFEVDADEVPSRQLLVDLHEILADADAQGVDCIGIPRLNFHDGILQAGPGHAGLDYQYRLHRRSVRWHKPVHEEPIGYNRRTELAIGAGHFLLHLKTAARHAERNALYARLSA